MGFVIIDGGGPFNPPASGDGFVTPPPPPPPTDSGGGATVKGKFCHAVSINGKQISLALQIGGMNLAATTGTCSACLGIPVGHSTLYIYSGGQKVGGGSVSIQAGRDYVFWMVYDPSTKKAQLKGGALNPSKGQNCTNFTPKL